MNIQKLICALLLSIHSIGIANQINIKTIRKVYYASQKKKEQAQEYEEQDVDVIDIEIEDDLDSEHIKELEPPLWARLANKIVAPFFQLYNWWHRDEK